jgi:phytoene synthase
VKMESSVATSYRLARKIARSRARNFYFGICLLPAERRDALCAIYAFMREADDIADGTDALQARTEKLHQWRAVLDGTLEGDCSGSPISPAFHDAVRRYLIPAEYFHELMTGTEMDLNVRSYASFADLYQYCYRVASVVGLCSLHVFGFSNPQAKELAERCGIAFQLTNILRDLREDASNGRTYLPQEDLQQFGVNEDQFVSGKHDEAFARLFHFEAARARQYYEQAWPLIGMVDDVSRPALWTMISIYRKLLEAIDRNPALVLRRRVSLPVLEKALVAARATATMIRMRLGLSAGGVKDWQPLV